MANMKQVGRISLNLTIGLLESVMKSSQAVSLSSNPWTVSRDIDPCLPASETDISHLPPQPLEGQRQPLQLCHWRRYSGRAITRYGSSQTLNLHLLRTCSSSDVINTETCNQKNSVILMSAIICRNYPTILKAEKCFS